MASVRPRETTNTPETISMMDEGRGGRSETVYWKEWPNRAIKHTSPVPLCQLIVGRGFFAAIKIDIDDVDIYYVEEHRQHRRIDASNLVGQHFGYRNRITVIINIQITFIHNKDLYQFDVD